MKQTWCVILAVFAGALSMFGQNVAGDWHGTLNTGGPTLRIALHISKSSDGTLSGTMDSVDQGANGIPLSAVSMQGSSLKFSVDVVHGTYEGKIAADEKSIAGTWTQVQPLQLDFERGPLPAVEHKPAKPSDIDGNWEGTLDIGTAKLRIVFHILNTQDGLTATADSPDQGAKGIPVSKVTHEGSSLTLEIQALNARFDGKISDDRKTISGTFTQAGNAVPLVLKTQTTS